MNILPPELEQLHKKQNFSNKLYNMADKPVNNKDALKKSTAEKSVNGAAAATSEEQPKTSKRKRNRNKQRPAAKITNEVFNFFALLYFICEMRPYF